MNEETGPREGSGAEEGEMEKGETRERLHKKHVQRRDLRFNRITI